MPDMNENSETQQECFGKEIFRQPLWETIINQNN